MDKLYVLRNIDKKNLIKEPFPHFIIKNPLEDKVYNELLRKFPINGFFGKYENNGQNQRKNFRGYDVLRDNKYCTQIWKDFVTVNSNKRIYRDIAELFDLDEKDPTIRMRYETEEADVELDCQLCINTPVINKSSVKLAHVDEQDKIWCILYYFPRKGDNFGGDLEIYSKVNNKNVDIVNNCVTNPDAINLQNVVKYEPNTLVLFLNSKDSIHAVSPRNVCNMNRQFVNIIARKTNFDVDDIIINRE